MVTPYQAESAGLQIVQVELAGALVIGLGGISKIQPAQAPGCQQRGLLTPGPPLQMVERVTQTGRQLTARVELRACVSASERVTFHAVKPSSPVSRIRDPRKTPDRRVKNGGEATSNCRVMGGPSAKRPVKVSGPPRKGKGKPPTGAPVEGFPGLTSSRS